MRFLGSFIVVLLLTLGKADAQQGTGAVSSPASTNAAAMTAVDTNAAALNIEAQVSAGDLDLHPKAGAAELLTDGGKPENKIIAESVSFLKDLSPLAPADRVYLPPAPRRGGPAVITGDYIAVPSDTNPKRKLSPRAWSTTVGWYPGQSAFANDIVHWP